MVRDSIAHSSFVFTKRTHSDHLPQGGPIRDGWRHFTPQMRRGAPAVAAFHFVKVPKIKQNFLRSG